MPKIRILSDLHLEFGRLDLQPAGEDVIVLAGDIDLGIISARRALRLAIHMGVPVVMTAGNHEFYGGTHSGVIERLYAVAEASAGHLNFLENDEVVCAGVRFLGATLWTDFNLDGDPIEAKKHAGFMMNDYHMIRTDRGTLHPHDTETMHRAAREFIETKLSDAGGPTVIVTHMAPSRRSIHADYHDSPLNPTYASNLDELVEHSGAALWVHGHMHDSFDYKIGETRVVCNPRGYVGLEVNREFNPNLVIEI